MRVAGLGRRCNIGSGGWEGRFTGTGVRVYYGNAFLARAMLEEALLGAVIARACEACKVEENWHFLRCCLRWQV
jgi:hypothetical protein